MQNNFICERKSYSNYSNMGKMPLNNKTFQNSDNFLNLFSHVENTVKKCVAWVSIGS